MEIGARGRLTQLAELLADLVHHTQCILLTGVRQHDREFLAAIAADMVGLAQALLEEQGQTLEDAVADGMAVGVVDLLEVIEVQHDEGQWLAAVVRPADLRFEQAQCVGVVVQACKTVADHQCQQ